jgi:DNA ligase D-like protein (predicted ligase)
VDGGGVHLWSRNRKPLDSAYPEIVTALGRAVRGHGIFDGEIVAIDPATGQSSFSLLQRRMQLRDAIRAPATGVAVQYWVFDCLFYEGADLTALPLRDRKAALATAVRFAKPIHLTPTWATGFERRFQATCEAGGEGLIAKRASSRYTGGRSTEWRKLKCVATQELVIGGWTDPRGSRERIGALLVGYFDGGRLRYAGKVGTGFDRFTLARLAAQLAPLARKRSPFSGPAPSGGDVHWVAPTLVAQIGFSEWTPDGLLRHPRFLGLRDDKAPAAVRRERRLAR